METPEASAYVRYGIFVITGFGLANLGEGGLTQHKPMAGCVKTQMFLLECFFGGWGIFFGYAALRKRGA